MKKTTAEQIESVARILGIQKADVVMPKGIYRGQDLSEVPKNYLNWVLENTQWPILKDIELELDRRVKQRR